jgi:hypothetical protein
MRCIQLHPRTHETLCYKNREHFKNVPLYVEAAECVSAHIEHASRSIQVPIYGLQYQQPQQALCHLTLALSMLASPSKCAVLTDMSHQTA